MVYGHSFMALRRHFENQRRRWSDAGASRQSRRMTFRVPILLLFAWIASVPAPAAVYFVSPQGNDNRSGESPAEAWKTVDRVNRHIQERGLRPGDAIRFRGGGRFPGHLVIDGSPGGTESGPILVSSYDSGRATLLPAGQTGILIRETPWVTVSNLNLEAGQGNDGDGIRCDRVRQGPTRIPGLTIRDCTITGFAWHGIMVDALQHTNGFERIRIEDCVTSRNRHAGIMIYGGNPTGRTGYPHSDLAVRRCLAADNPGDPDLLQHHSGSGIFVDGVDSGEVTDCVSAGNGAECRSERGGPVGIWAHASRRIVITRCESFGNQSLLRDGGGFDLDGGCEDSILRGNFSHDNHGPGFLVYTYHGAPYADRGCRILENISIHDGARGSGYAGVEVGAEDGCRISELEVARNTVIAPSGSVGAVRISGHNIQAVIRDNLVLAPEHGVLVTLSGFQHKLSFEGNRYWRTDGIPVFLVDAQWPVPSLELWRNSTGPETRFTARNEVFVNPKLKGNTGWSTRYRERTPRWPDLNHPLGTGVGAPLVRP